MRDTKAFLSRDKRVILRSYQGSTVFFSLSDLPFLPDEVTVQSDIRNKLGVKVGEFIVTKNTTSLDFELPFTVTEQLTPTERYISDEELLKKISTLNNGVYYFDVEITENNKKYKLFTGLLVLLPEYTKEYEGIS